MHFVQTVPKNCTTDELQFYLERSVERGPDLDDQYVFYLSQPCKHYDGTGCKIYKTRPQICKEFPTQAHPSMIGKCALMRKGD